MPFKHSILLLLLTCTFNILPWSNNYSKNKKPKKPKLINKNFSDLTFDELKHNKNIHIANNIDSATLAKNIERMISLCKVEEHEKICELRLELADVYFNGHNLDKAANHYKEFAKQYPGHNKAEYALYREIQANFKETLDFDRDQAKTKEALKLSEDFITKSKNEEYLTEINKIIQQCRKKLLKSEVSMFYFYLKKLSFKAAQKRLDYLKNDFFKNPEQDENDILLKLQEDLKLAQENKHYIPLDLNARDAKKNLKPAQKKSYLFGTSAKLPAVAKSYSANMSEVAQRAETDVERF